MSLHSSFLFFCKYTTCYSICHIPLQLFGDVSLCCCCCLSKLPNACSFPEWKSLRRLSRPFSISCTSDTSVRKECWMIGAAWLWFWLALPPRPAWYLGLSLIPLENDKQGQYSQSKGMISIIKLPWLDDPYLLLLLFWLEWVPMLLPWPTCRPPEEALFFRPEPPGGAAVLVDVLGLFLFNFRSSITSCYWGSYSKGGHRGQRSALTTLRQIPCLNPARTMIPTEN